MSKLLRLAIVILLISNCASAREIIVKNKEAEICKQIKKEASSAKLLFDYIILKLCTNEDSCIEIRCQL